MLTYAPIKQLGKFIPFGICIDKLPNSFLLTLADNSICSGGGGGINTSSFLVIFGGV